MSGGRRRRGIAFIAVALFAVGVIIWASDRITLQGERTIFTVKCENGTWDGTRCTGKLAAGERYSFRVSPLRREVLYWVRGSSEPSDKFTDCKVVDRDNWMCTFQPGQKPTIAVGMKKGRPLGGNGANTLAFHDVPKWKWWLLDYGVSMFKQATN